MKTRGQYGMRAKLCALAFVMAIVSAAFAQAPEITIGQSAGYTGRTSTSVKEFNEGAQACFDNVNKQGGVAGRKIFFTTLDEAKRPWRLWRCFADSEDPPVLVFEENDARFNVGIDRSRSGVYLFLVVASHTTSEVWYASASALGSFVRQVRRQRIAAISGQSNPRNA